jgi:D-glycero-D-manno-heptose 1,7-bisphosphate phosphatase
MNRAVFLDRDGTVTEEVGYLTSLDMLKLIRGAGAAIKRLNEAGYKVVLVTNQSGVARGYFPESLVDDAHSLLRRMLLEDGAQLDGIYYCPHHPTAGTTTYTIVCDCRKPETGLLDRAAKDLAIDLEQSFMVGDKWSDVELGRRAGMRSILVRTGFSPDDPGNRRPAHTGDPDLMAHDLAEAVQWIIGQKVADRP